MRYNMPPNDPRNLEADDELVLQDLVVLRYRDLMVRLATDPDFAASYAAEGGELEQAIMDFRATVVNTKAFLEEAARAIQASRKRSGTAKSASLEPPQITGVALRKDE